jgi:hypothetical protein
MQIPSNCCFSRVVLNPQNNSRLEKEDSLCPKIN